MVFGCQKVSKKSSNNDFFDFEDNSVLGDIRHSTQLEFFAYFVECGEFGGHKEKIIMYRDDKNEILYIDFLIDTATCSFYDTLNFQKSQTVILGEKQEQAVANYLQNLLERSLTNQFPVCHVTEFYKAIKYSDFTPDYIDTTMILEYHSCSENWQSFQSLKKNLGIKE